MRAPCAERAVSPDPVSSFAKSTFMTPEEALPRGRKRESLEKECKIRLADRIIRVKSEPSRVFRRMTRCVGAWVLSNSINEYQ